MPAKLERYIHRNKEVGCIAVYDISKSNPPLARLWIGSEDQRIPDGTRAKIVDVYDFDSPFVYELEDGRRTRAGGIGWHHYRTTAEADEWHPRKAACTRCGSSDTRKATVYWQCNTCHHEWLAA